MCRGRGILLVGCSQLLFSDRAGESWVEPDLKPIFSKMPLSFVHPVHRATHRIGLYLDKLDEPGLTQGEAHILAMLAHSGLAKVAELHRGLAHKRSTLTSILDWLAKGT